MSRATNWSDRLNFVLRGPGALDGWRVDVANMAGRMGSIDVTHEFAVDVRGALVFAVAMGCLVGGITAGRTSWTSEATLVLVLAIARCAPLPVKSLRTAPMSCAA